MRAIQSSLEISTVLTKMKMIHAIGITTGNVFCGSVGSSKRQEYAMVKINSKLIFVG